MLGAAPPTFYSSNAAPETQVNMNTADIPAIGGGLSHTNLMPTLCINFIISLFGIYPSQD